MSLRSYIYKILAVFGLLFVLMTPASAMAFDVKDGIDCKEGADSAVCRTTTSADPLTGQDGIIRTATKIIAIITGIAATIVIVIAGFSYITSNGDAEAISRSKKTIIFAAVGLLVVVLGQAIINFVLNRI